MKEIVVVYHKNCPDGFGAAFAAWKKFGSKAEYFAVQHNTPVPEVLVNKLVYLVDFCYPAAVMSEIVKKNKKVICIDHHVTMESAVREATEYVYNLEHSGAVLSWLYFHPKKKVPRLLEYIEDVDLWKFRLSETKEVMAFLDMYEYDFQEWDGLMKVFDNEKKRALAVEKGALLLRYKERLIKSIVEKCKVLVEFEGYNVFAVNSSKFNSEIGSVLYKELPPVAVVWEQIGNKFIVSLRSDGSVDVGKIAVKYGGGGHKAASGFAVAVENGFPWKILGEKK